MESQRKARFATRQQKRAILIIQDFKCASCGCDADSFEFDHVVPFSAGGNTSLENLQALCRTCHNKKTLSDGSLKRS